ncbi:uncharacterized protein LOC116388188 [Anarrhichthys ocellatus]|uniref:uncharacterized protein LOC116388188 n=1 Tax=Anarrhichthys ocellatus TaxID=433405 RepID=UPI0012EDACC4|nr:uncharacterized protein LOC116388188 [Anarrhichthys ocellatus]
MNLYKSFGNLMEAWVAEVGQISDTAWLGNNDEDLPTPSSDVGTNLRSESVDSGVETASSVMSFPATPSSVSTGIAEIDIFPPEREGDGLTPASTSQSPVLSSPEPSSSSSPHLLPSKAQVGSAALHLKVERALKKTDSKHLKNKREPLTVDEMLRRHPRSSFEPKQHASELVRGQRSQSVALKRTVKPSVLPRQMSVMWSRPMSTSCDKQPAQTRAEDLGEQEGTRLSPGFCYLEQVCQMLEEVARQQMHSRALQMETDALREHQNIEVNQTLITCQSDSKAAEEDVSFCESLENTESAEPSEPQPRRDYPYRHFRQRSASDTTLHIINADYRGQHLSTHDLLEKDEEDHENQGSDKEETDKKRNWRMKFGSWTQEEYAVRDTKGQKTHSSERNSARRRLSQMFRRKKTPLE